jgi:hypothetical protein
MPPVNYAKPLSDCFAAQRRLFEAAHALARRVGRASEEDADLLRMGGSCVRIAAERAIASRVERDAIAAWRECELGERQIRLATYRAMRRGCIGTTDYDALFVIAARASWSRRDEIDRLRMRVQALSLI